MVRGEGYLAELGIHPKVLQLFDHCRKDDQGDVDNIWGNCTVGSKIPKERASPEYLEHLVRGCFDQVESRIGDYPTAREFFTHNLAAKMSSKNENGGRDRVLFRTTDFKCHELVDLMGCEWFEDFDHPSEIGFRGLGRYVSSTYRDLLEWELEACRMVAKDSGIELVVVFPFVRTVTELKKGLEIVADIDIGVTALGMTISVPINVLLVDEFAEELRNHADRLSVVPFFVFDLEDLTHSLGGVSKNDARMMEGVEIRDPLLKENKKLVLYDECAPAVVDSVTHTLLGAQRFRVRCGIPYDKLVELKMKNEDFALALIGKIDFLIGDAHTK